MRKGLIVFLSFLIGLFLTNVSLADIPSPPVAQEIRIELSQNYPDYQFYFCSYKIEVKPNPNPPHPSRPNMIVGVPESFEQKLIELTADKPFIQPITSHIQYRSDKLSERVYWLVAIKKSQVAELESKIKSTVLDSKPIEGIKSARLEDSLPISGDWIKGAKIVVNKVSIGEKEMELKVEEGTASVGKVANCVGLGLLLTGIALIGGWWSKNKYIRNG